MLGIKGRNQLLHILSFMFSIFYFMFFIFLFYVLSRQTLNLHNVLFIRKLVQLLKILLIKCSLSKKMWLNCSCAITGLYYYSHCFPPRTVIELGLYQASESKQACCMSTSSVVAYNGDMVALPLSVA